jgi:glycosidase
MFDFVPNHMGLDHPWTEDHPDYRINSVRRATNGTATTCKDAACTRTWLPGRHAHFP